MTRATILLLPALLLAGCCCPQPSSCPPVLEAEHLYLGLRAQRFDVQGSEAPQVLIEGQLIRTRRSSTEMSADLAALGLPRVAAGAWVGRSAAKLYPRASDTVIAAPSILSTSGDLATIMIGEVAEDGFPRSGLQIRVTPAVQGDEVSLEVEFEQFRDRQVVWHIPLRTFRVPDGGTLVLAAEKR